MGSRITARIGAISESATLAVDSKAKALKAAGRPVIGFGAGEPQLHNCWRCSILLVHGRLEGKLCECFGKTNVEADHH
jgi:hypothetical protein